MKIEKKVLLWQIIFRSVGSVAAIAVIQNSQLWTIVFGILTVIASEMKDYYLKQQDAVK